MDTNGDGYLSDEVEKTSIGFMGEERTEFAAPDDAAVFDAAGRNDCDVQFLVNTLYVKTRQNQTEIKTVNGREIEFTKNYSSGQIGSWKGVSVAPGYVVASGFSPNQQWAWSTYYGSGWSPELYVVPTAIPYTHDGVFGDWGDDYVTYYSCKVDKDTTLYLVVRDSDSWFTLTGVPGTTRLTGYGTKATTIGWGGPSTTFTFDEKTAKVLIDAGLTSWYGTTVTLVEGGPSKSFSFKTDVSKALITDMDAYTIETVANKESVTGYTTTITVKDNGYQNVYAFGDWVSVDADGNQHGPDAWQNGYEYATSSALPMTFHAEDDTWVLTLNLASSVMGVICYHDVADAADLANVKPQKTSFYVPYDAEKQSQSTDWTPAFPAEENEVNAGTIAYTTTGDGLSVAVYTPNGYDAEAVDGYPVIYLIPGGGSTYQSWFTQGMAGNIFDNLIASNAVKPTIVVSMQREDVNDGKLGDIIEWVEANYNVAAGAANRALGGVSMGSVAATQLWLDDPTQFGYYAFLSGADKTAFSVRAEGFEYPELTESEIEKLSQVIFLGGGTTDFNMYTGDANSASVTDLDAWMTHYEIGHNLNGNRQYDVTAGDHNWPIWMKLMIPFVSGYLWK